MNQLDRNGRSPNRRVRTVARALLVAVFVSYFATIAIIGLFSDGNAMPVVPQDMIVLQR